jgi:hypothetical protein
VRQAMFIAIVSACVALAGIPPSRADDSAPALEPEKIYRCERQTTPLFTNRPSYGCPEYEPQGALRVAPNGVMFLEPPQPPTTRPFELDESRLCQLYDEWLLLNERTAGGFFYSNTAQTARYFALSRIFSSIGIPPVSRCLR